MQETLSLGCCKVCGYNLDSEDLKESKVNYCPICGMAVEKGKVPVGVGAPDKDKNKNIHLNCKTQTGESQMKNRYELIGQLKIMKAFSQNEMQRSYLNDAILALIRWPETVKQCPERTKEITGALDMLSYKSRRREAEALRDTVEYLESLDCEVEV